MIFASKQRFKKRRRKEMMMNNEFFYNFFYKKKFHRWWSSVGVPSRPPPQVPPDPTLVSHVVAPAAPTPIGEAPTPGPRTGSFPH
jgi:hypothetical protein